MRSFCENGKTLKYTLLLQAFVFDFGSEMYVWTGKHVPFAQRKIAIKLAREVWERCYDYTDCDINPICPLKSKFSTFPGFKIKQ